MTDLAQHRLLHGQIIFEHFRIELVQTGIHYFHAYPDITLATQGTVKVHRIWTITRTHRYVQIHNQTLLFTEIDRHWNTFYGQNCARLPVSHLLDNPVGTATQIADLLQTIGIDFERLIANLYVGP